MVSSYTQLIARRYKDKLDDDAHEFIDYAVDGVTRMQQLIEDLLAYSRVGTQGNEFDVTDCSQAFDRAVANLRMAIEVNNVSVTCDALPTVKADSSQLIQLFQNLMGNAIKFMRPDATAEIHVSAIRDSNEWVFSVEDNGIGIEPEYGERIFAIFQRLHTKDEYPGTGIGLAICKKIVDRHGGRIWVESEPMKGSAFNFTLPVNGG